MNVFTAHFTLSSITTFLAISQAMLFPEVLVVFSTFRSPIDPCTRGVTFQEYIYGLPRLLVYGLTVPPWLPYPLQGFFCLVNSETLFMDSKSTNTTMFYFFYPPPKYLYFFGPKGRDVKPPFHCICILSDIKKKLVIISEKFLKKVYWYYNVFLDFPSNISDFLGGREGVKKPQFCSSLFFLALKKIGDNFGKIF